MVCQKHNHLIHEGRFTMTRGHTRNPLVNLGDAVLHVARVEPTTAGDRRP